MRSSARARGGCWPRRCKRRWDAYIARFASERGEDGRRRVVRNGYHQSREVLTSAGAVEVTMPRVNDKRTDPATGERMRFCSVILPPWCRKTPKVTEVLPLLYLHGLSSGDFVPALGQFLGSSAGCRRTGARGMPARGPCVDCEMATAPGRCAQELLSLWALLG
jgi:hypothetical protein